MVSNEKNAYFALICKNPLGKAAQFVVSETEDISI
jgi:hypothetical protein